MINETFVRMKMLKNKFQVEGYKSTSVGIIPNNWDEIGIEECSKSIFLGLTSKVDYVEKGGYPLIRTKDISNGVISFKNVRYISDEQHKQLTRFRKAEKGDVLVSKSGTLGTCCLVNVDQEFSIYESIIVIKPDYSKLVGQYLLHLLRDNAVQERMLGAKVGGTVSHLNLKHFRDLKLPLPPLDEQTKIAEILSTWDKAIELKEQLIKEKRQQKKGLMKKLLTGEVRYSRFEGEWENIELGELCEFINGYAFKSSSYSEIGKYYIVTIGNVKDGYLDITDNTKMIREIPINVSNNQVLSLDDILISMTGNVGRVCKVNQENCLLNQRVGKLIVNANVCADFIYQSLRSSMFLDQMISNSQGGAQGNLSMSDIKSYRIKLPKEDEQIIIANTLNLMDSQYRLLKQELEALKLQKKGLMQLLLTGIVRVPCESEL